MTVRSYVLPVVRIDGTDTVKGIELIHDALLEGRERPDERLLIMDTTREEHKGLLEYAVEMWPSTAEEIERLEAALAEMGPETEPVVFEPPAGTGIPERIEYIERFLTERYPAP